MVMDVRKSRVITGPTEEDGGIEESNKSSPMVVHHRQKSKIYGGKDGLVGIPRCLGGICAFERRVIINEGDETVQKRECMDDEACRNRDCTNWMCRRQTCMVW